MKGGGEAETIRTKNRKGICECEKRRRRQKPSQSNYKFFGYIFHNN